MSKSTKRTWFFQHPKQPGSGPPPGKNVFPKRHYIFLYIYIYGPLYIHRTAHNVHRKRLPRTYVEVWLTYVEVWLKYVEVWLTYVEVWLKYVEVWLKYVEVWLKYVEVWLTYVEVWLKYDIESK